MAPRPDPPRRSVGFVGVGAMGGPMVRNLAEAGHLVTAYDVRREAPAGRAGGFAVPMTSALRELCDEGEKTFLDNMGHVTVSFRHELIERGTCGAHEC